MNIKDMGSPPHQGNQPTPQQIATALNSAEYLQCKTDNCGGTMFLPASAFKRLSRIALATDQDAIVPVELMVCAKCGSVLSELLPDGMKDDFSPN